MSRGKTWVYWLEQVTRQFRVLYPDRFDSVGMVPWYLKSEERDQIIVKCQKTANAYCEYFSENKVWPELSPEERCAIYFRVDHAYKLLEEFAAIFSNKTNVVVRPPDSKITSEAEVWRFLLIYWWEAEFKNAENRQRTKQVKSTDFESCSDVKDVENEVDMIGKPCILDWTVMDLCEVSYRKPHGFFCETIKTFDFLTVTRWRLVVVCFNAKIGDNTSAFDSILKKYAPLLIKSLPYDVKVQSILNMCKERELPIVAQVADDAEKCLIIATCHEPWTTWFLSIFGDYDDAECIAVNNELSPTITEMLVNLHRQKKEPS